MAGHVTSETFAWAMRLLNLPMNATRHQIETRINHYRQRFNPAKKPGDPQYIKVYNAILLAQRILDSYFLVLDIENKRRKSPENKEWVRQQYAKYQEEQQEKQPRKVLRQDDDVRRAIDEIRQKIAAKKAAAAASQGQTVNVSAPVQPDVKVAQADKATQVAEAVAQVQAQQDADTAKAIRAAEIRAKRVANLVKARAAKAAKRAARLAEAARQEELARVAEEKRQEEAARQEELARQEEAARQVDADVIQDKPAAGYVDMLFGPVEQPVVVPTQAEDQKQDQPTDGRIDLDSSDVAQPDTENQASDQPMASAVETAEKDTDTRSDDEIRASNEAFLREQEQLRRQAVAAQEASVQKVEEMPTRESEEIRASNEAFLREQAQIHHQASQDLQERLDEENKMANQRKVKFNALRLAEEAEKSEATRRAQANIAREERIKQHIDRMKDQVKSTSAEYTAAQGKLNTILYALPRPIDYKAKVKAQKRKVHEAYVQMKEIKKHLAKAEKQADRGKFDLEAEDARWAAEQARLSEIAKAAKVAAEQAKRDAENARRSQVMAVAEKIASTKKPGSDHDDNHINGNGTSAASVSGVGVNAGRTQTSAPAARPGYAAIEQASIPVDQDKPKTLKDYEQRLKQYMQQPITPKQQRRVDRMWGMVEKIKSLQKYVNYSVVAQVVVGLLGYLAKDMNILEMELNVETLTISTIVSASVLTASSWVLFNKMANKRRILACEYQMLQER